MVTGRMPPTSLRDWDTKLSVATPWNGSSQSWAPRLLGEDRADVVEVEAADDEEVDAGDEEDDWDVVDEEEPAGVVDEVRRPLGRGRRLRSV